jgi:predicted RNA binding protein YcfA (HicA-like mRNA interferase family)
MTKLPSLKAKDVIKGLNKLGFIKVRQKGGHAIFHHSDCRRSPLPLHPTKDISPYLLSDILKQLRITEDEFLKAIGQKQNRQK